PGGRREARGRRRGSREGRRSEGRPGPRWEGPRRRSREEGLAREVCDGRVGERVVRAFEAPQLDLILVGVTTARDRDRTTEPLRMRAKSFDRVVGGLSRRDQERPVARLREQQLAHGLASGALT